MVQGRARDLSFPVVGDLLPREHRWNLSAAIRRACPFMCSSNCLGIFPIRGQRAAGDLIRLPKSSVLRIRLNHRGVCLYRGLAGEVLDVQGHLIRLGPPVSRAIEPRQTLYSDVVFFEGGRTREDVMIRIGQELRMLGVHGDVRSGEAVRFHSWKGECCGYEIGVSGLCERDSLTLQEKGVGDLRILGCGLFEPWSGRKMHRA
ncbi:MAG TPA: type I-MYXAN CRISPR-associated protein Cas6/Cmx6 [Desulfomicrobiaceae bacterium]|nr:type I-MYXAN CRISPR-associated protein Cas6/Cmx6 [Desulfomicrobiaceae bacterium]